MSDASDPLHPVAAALFRSMGVAGVVARSALFIDVQNALEHYIARHRPIQAELLRFPPVMSRIHLEKSGYLHSFPQLLGCVCALRGSEASIQSALEARDPNSGEEWTAALQPTDLILSPAACYPLYPLVAERGPVPGVGLRFDIEADCFRHEPSPHLDRLQSFRMREFVCIGSPAQALEFRDAWIRKATGIAADLGLPHAVEVANDPFFGRVGRVKAVSQRQQALKFELLIPLHAAAAPTACMSFNYHRDHFGTVWNIRDEQGVTAHSSCVAFGIDRLAIALVAIHGVLVDSWPVEVRNHLHL